MTSPRSRLPALLALLLLAPPAAAQGPMLSTGLGLAGFSRSSAGARDDASGVALELRVSGKTAPRTGYAVTLTWGLTDWDRAGEWIDAGDRAGSWTTDRFADVEAWVRRGKDDDTQGLRLLGAVFADLFLATTYVAVPACYVGSVGGATSHLQLDATGSLHLGDGATDAWLELGGGVAALPERFPEWRSAFGPVLGVGLRAGAVRVGARLLWSPPALNTSIRGGTVVTSALTATLVR